MGILKFWILHNMQIILKQGKFLSIYTVIQLFILLLHFTGPLARWNFKPSSDENIYAKIDLTIYVVYNLTLWCNLSW